MNPLKNQNKFEDKLKKQLEELEIKPGTSLWDRIASNIPADGFETVVKEKLEAIEINPHPDTWPKIERQLPVSDTSYRAWIFVGVFALIFTLGISLGYLLNEKYNAKNSLQTRQPEKAENGSLSSAGNKPASTPVLSAPNAPLAMNATANRVAHTTGNPSKRRNTLPASQGQARPQQPARSVTATPALVQRIAPAVVATAATVLSSEAAAPPSAPLEVVPANNPHASPVQNGSPMANIAPVPDSLNISQPAMLAKAAAATDSPVVSKVQPMADSTLSQAVAKNNSNTVNPEDYAAVKLDINKLSITAFAGSNVGLMHYEAPDGNSQFDKNIEFRRKVESPAPDFTGGFLLGYELSSRWRVSSGIIITNSRQELHYDVASPVNQYTSREQGANYINLNDSIVDGGNNVYQIKYSFTEIPLWVTYKLVDKTKFELSIQGGLSLGIISGVNAYIINQNNVGILVLNQTSDFPRIRNTGFFTLQPSIGYRYSDDVTIGIIPSFKTSLSSIIQNQYWVQQYPYFVGLHAFIRKTF